MEHGAFSQGPLRAMWCQRSKAKGDWIVRALPPFM